jgi:hypothetical protein
MEVAFLKKLYEENCQELENLADKLEKSELKSKEIAEEMDVSSSKYKEEVENLNKKVKDGDDVLTDKQKVIDALVSKVDLNVARSILTSFNDDTKIILPENDTNKNSTSIINDNEPCSDPEVVKRQKAFENFISKNGTKNSTLCICAGNKIILRVVWALFTPTELEVFKSQLVVVESERKEIHSRLLIMMSKYYVIVLLLPIIKT